MTIMYATRPHCWFSLRDMKFSWFRWQLPGEAAVLAIGCVGMRTKLPDSQ